MSASFLTEESEKNIQLVEINVEYSYCGSTRLTPIFLVKKQLYAITTRVKNKSYSLITTRTMGVANRLSISLFTSKSENR